MNGALAGLLISMTLPPLFWIGTSNVFLLAGGLAVAAALLVFVFFRVLSAEEQKGISPPVASPKEAPA